MLVVYVRDIRRTSASRCGVVDEAGAGFAAQRIYPPAGGTAVCVNFCCVGTDCLFFYAQTRHPCCTLLGQALTR